MMREVEQAVWSAAAWVLTLDGRGDSPLERAASDVVRTLGLASDPGLDDSTSRAMVAQTVAPIHQVSALLREGSGSWADQSDDALLAQGRASGRAAQMMAEHLLARLTGLDEAFATSGTRMLDVGTGVAGMAVGYAEQFPALTVVGIDVMPRVLALARRTVAASAAADRVVLREQSVTDLDEEDVYAFAWVPAPFLPQDALEAGVRRVAASLVPGGWLMLGHAKLGGDPLEDALSRFKTVAYGGTALDDDQAAALLRDAGLVEVMTVPSPPGAPALTLGRREPQARTS